MDKWVITGSRADYGCLKYIIEKSNYIHVEIKIGGNKFIDYQKSKIEVPIRDREIPSMFGNVIIEFTKLYQMFKPTMIIVLGDRWEMLATCIPSIFNDIPIMHIGGGEVSKGSYDEIFRHSISKMAKYHFVISKECKERLIKQGIKENIYVVGSPRLDYDVEKIKKITYRGKTALVILHPETMNRGIDYRIFFDALREIDINYIVLESNRDVDDDKIFKLIGEFSYENNVEIEYNVLINGYLRLMKSVDIMIGNSSSGIMESASFHLPVVNVGDRQKGRDRQQNVIDVGWNKEEIKKAIKKGLSKDFKNSIEGIKNVYSNNASEKIINILEGLDG